METPTVPVYVNETGRMEIRYGGKGRQRYKGRQGTVEQTQHLAAFCRPLPPLDFRGCSPGAAILSSAPDGAVAQLGERLDRTQEVRGSSPLSSILRTAPWCNWQHA